MNQNINQPTTRGVKIGRIIITIVLMVIIILSFYYSYHEYSHIQRRNLIATYRSKITTIINRNHSALSAKDVSYISSWMTFDYINKIFKLPPAYLKQTMAINNPTYPLITINQYARRTAMNNASLVKIVQDNVSAYFASSTVQ